MAGTGRRGARKLATIGELAAVCVAALYLLSTPSAASYENLVRGLTGPKLKHDYPRNRLLQGARVRLEDLTLISGSAIDPQAGPWLLTAFDAACVVSLQSVPYWTRIGAHMTREGFRYALVGCAETADEISDFGLRGNFKGTLYFASCRLVNQGLKANQGIVHYAIGSDGSVLDAWQGMPIRQSYEDDAIAQMTLVLRGGSAH